MAGAEDPQLRHFKIPKSWASSPQDDLQGGAWQAASPDRVGDFTAVGYYFAQRVRSEVGVPIGLLNATWGGSNIESWMDAPLLGRTRAEIRGELQAIERTEAETTEAVKRRIERWPGALSADYENAKADWSAPDLDESDWVEIDVPSLWEDANFNGLDGVAWYRTSFDLQANQTGHDLQLGLARIDDRDVTYVNGFRVGQTDIYNAIRLYTIDRSQLREGRNTLAVRVLDTGGGGGIWSEPALLYLRGPAVDLPLAGTWLFKVDKGDVLTGSGRNLTPTALYNAMMHPLFRVPVKGVLWYQGEANANEPDGAFAYRSLFRAMISDWRNKWHDEGLPFYWVQLANFISHADTGDVSPWAILRESQTDALNLPHTGQAVIIDVGDPDDIHPRDKRTVGNRLALHALKNDYGRPDTVADGPYAVDARLADHSVIVTFRSTGSLRAMDDQTVRGFELADREGRWHAAHAAVEGSRIQLTSVDAGRPSAVRYAWSDNPDRANLSDESGLPASPFRRSGL